MEPKRKRQKKHSKQIEYEKRIDFVTKFSDELILHVFYYLSERDLIQCTTVNSRWSRLANDEMLWKPLFFQRFRDPILFDEHRAQLIHKRRVSVTRYGGSWKTKYRVNHNWLSGNCRISDIKTISRFAAPYTPDHLQFIQDAIFTVQPNSPTIEVWKYIQDEFNLLFALKAAGDILNSITFLKIFEGETMTHLIAGYSNGGFTLWELRQDDPTHITELTSYQPSHLSSEKCNQKVNMICMEYPIIVVCTEEMKLSIFNVYPSLQLVHQLQSSNFWSPVIFDIQKVNNTTQPTWKIMTCFGIDLGNNSSSLGVQEITVSPNKILSSRHGSILSPDDFYLPSDSNIEPITTMCYAPPYLITAHPNNTIKQFLVQDDDGTLQISYKCTLYGHTFKVDALAVDVVRQRLISGDRSGIKVWDLDKECCQVTIENHRNQSTMSELPLFEMNSLGFDEDKIIAAVQTEKTLTLRLWSFILEE